MPDEAPGTMDEVPTYDGVLTCCGEVVAADAAAVQRVMTSHLLTASQQGREWVRLSHLYPEPQWIEECLRAARRMAAAVEEERAVMEVLGGGVDFAEPAGRRRRPADVLALRHFEWLGERRKVPVEVVRDGIVALARGGFISDDAEQQAALRRGLGIAVNNAERNSRAPWVRWMGSDDTLHYLVASLWDMDLIYCSGGLRDKWKTLCGVFLRADATLYETSIKSCRCRNDAKRRAIDEAILDGLRFVS